MKNTLNTGIVTGKTVFGSTVYLRDIVDMAKHAEKYCVKMEDGSLAFHFKEGEKSSLLPVDTAKLLSCRAVKYCGWQEGDSEKLYITVSLNGTRYNLPNHTGVIRRVDYADVQKDLLRSRPTSAWVHPLCRMNDRKKGQKPDSNMWKERMFKPFKTNRGVNAHYFDQLIPTGYTYGRVNKNVYVYFNTQDFLSLNSFTYPIYLLDVSRDVYNTHRFKKTIVEMGSYVYLLITSFLYDEENKTMGAINTRSATVLYTHAEKRVPFPELKTPDRPEDSPFRVRIAENRRLINDVNGNSLAPTGFERGYIEAETKQDLRENQDRHRKTVSLAKSGNIVTDFVKHNGLVYEGMQARVEREKHALAHKSINERVELFLRGRVYPQNEGLKRAICTDLIETLLYRSYEAVRECFDVTSPVVNFNDRDYIGSLSFLSNWGQVNIKVSQSTVTLSFENEEEVRAELPLTVKDCCPAVISSDIFKVLEERLYEEADKQEAVEAVKEDMYATTTSTTSTTPTASTTPTIPSIQQRLEALLKQAEEEAVVEEDTINLHAPIPPHLRGNIGGYLRKLLRNYCEVNEWKDNIVVFTYHNIRYSLQVEWGSEDVSEWLTHYSVTGGGRTVKGHLYFDDYKEILVNPDMGYRPMDFFLSWLYGTLE